MKPLLIICLLFIHNALTASECDPKRTDYFCIEESRILNSEMSITNFYLIPFEIKNLFSEELDQVHYPINLDLQWKSPYFGAGVSFYEQQFKIMILGGTSRMKEMTEDAYAAIICHEIGHIIAGAPHQTIQHSEWSSSEGQADFFAASECLPKYFKNKKIEIKAINSKVEKAGFEFIKLAQSLDKKQPAVVRFKNYTFKTENTLINNYPSLQCRYEQYRSNKKRASCWYKED